MALPTLRDIQEAVEKQEGFLNWLVEIWRSKSWVRILLLIEVILLLFLNPVLLSKAVEYFNLKPPMWYGISWGVTVGLVFIAALIVSLRTAKHSISAPRSERRAIKGLRPYTFTDADIFARLQRNDILGECLVSICDRDFRFGILCGESGAGKTSFLQAGLWPNILNQNHRCVYVRFSDQPPLDSVKQALKDQLQLPNEALDVEFSILLQSIVRLDSKPLVLFFDQFEQFFVHQKLKSERKAFVRHLANWYQTNPTLPIKILICIRGDFSDRLIELQKVIGYSLGPQESFLLEKFDPKQATAIFRVIAEVESIIFDERFVEEVITQELASREDGLISPVDIQVLTWMIAGQQSSEERAFTRISYQKLGGVEGLLEMFLKRALAARETELRKPISSAAKSS